MRAQRALLRHHHHTDTARLAGPARRIRRAREVHRAAIGAFDPQQDAHQRALARAVLAEQRMRRAAVQHEVDAPQHRHGTECLLDAPRRE